ncbi:hypothetical protein ROZALSC1DRAFT_29841 [Rozella allomycis CSF55]|uniref:Uncharacterized protein n=1 Tax=Rozella allomycis (strain CSF55) TaxID=988480 RepID=A0A4V1IZL6_ROZAC|nr:hypothetical protein ROZALSC1DRAFT_29841 [Rozella allomycis CSF55]
MKRQKALESETIKETVEEKEDSNGHIVNQIIEKYNLIENASVIDKENVIEKGTNQIDQSVVQHQSQFNTAAAVNENQIDDISNIHHQFDEATGLQQREISQSQELQNAQDHKRCFRRTRRWRKCGYYFGKYCCWTRIISGWILCIQET